MPSGQLPLKDENATLPGGPCHFNQVKQVITLQGQLKIAWKRTTEILFSQKFRPIISQNVCTLVEAGG
jgi:hypothetical protein